MSAAVAVSLRTRNEPGNGLFFVPRRLRSPTLPRDDLQAADIFVVTVSRQKRQLMLTAERGDPDVVMKPFALLRIGRQCAAAQHLIARFDVVGNRPRVRSEDAG